MHAWLACMTKACIHEASWRRARLSPRPHQRMSASRADPHSRHSEPAAVGSTARLAPQPTQQSRVSPKLDPDVDLNDDTDTDSGDIQLQQQHADFYDSEADDKDEQWVQQQRQGRQSDAILSCPGCMTTVCIDCQRHEYYTTQYRAMFVMNCRYVQLTALSGCNRGSKSIFSHFRSAPCQMRMANLQDQQDTNRVRSQQAVTAW